MSIYYKIFLVSSFFILTLFINVNYSSADTITNCINSNPINNGVDSFSYGNTDCVSYSGIHAISWAVSLDRLSIEIISNTDSFSQVEVYDAQGNAYFYDGTSGMYYNSYSLGTMDLYDDGSYFINIYSGASISTTYVYHFYVVNGLIYENLSDVPITADNALEKSVGSVNYGLAIIIVLFSLFVITFIFNQMKSKKKWQ